MFTDMVGYTALGQRNESLSLALVEEQKRLVRPILSRHEGREVKTVGDAFFVEFPNVLEAVRCGYDIQRAVREFNFSLPEDRRVHLRIGIHLGDVVESQGDISGDAVNLASRIEPLADDGGVCITREVYSQVVNKFDLPIKSLGLKQLKNISAPVEVFKIEMPWEEQPEQPQKLDSRRIVILPFVSMSPDPNDEYFADGLTEELITKISLVSGLEVIARTSAMNYKKEKKNASQIGKELRVGTLLEGSVRKAGNRIRVSAQLIDANTEGHLWAENYDRDLDDIFAVQSSVAENVAGALQVKLLQKEKDRIERGRPKNPDAYVEFLRGIYFSHGADPGNMRKSVKYFERALELEPNYVAAMAWLGMQMGGLAFFGFEPMEASYAKAVKLAARSLELDDTVPEAHHAVAVTAFYIEGDWAKCLRECEKAIELNPSYREVHGEYALFLTSLGKFDRGVAEIEKTLELDPLSPDLNNIAGAIYALAGRFPEAMDQHRKSIEMVPIEGHTNLGVTFVLMGRMEDAVKEFETARALGGTAFFLGNLGYAYGVSNRREEALKVIEEIKTQPNRGSVSYASANVYAGLGEKEKAIDCLEEALRERALFTFPLFVVDPFLANLRDEPRFKELARKVGLDPVQLGKL